MAPGRPLDELIDRQRDQPASEADLAELERRLADPEARRAYVAAQRMNAWLEAILTEDAQVAHAQAACGALRYEREGRRRTRTRWVAVAAAVLLGVGAALWGLFGRHIPPPTLPGHAVQQGSPSTARAAADAMSPVTAASLFGLATATALK
jgi:hypothetical protein